MMNEIRINRRSGKSFYQIITAVVEAAKQKPLDPIIYVSSEKMRKRVEEIADMMGQKVKTEIYGK